MNELHIGLKGTMDALELKKIAEKTRRGARGSLSRGRVPGGVSYGYAAAPELTADGGVQLGLRRIVPEQADIVRRIFAEYVAGRGPTAIAKGLNKDGVPSPRGGEWRPSVIIGSTAKRTGILNNALYVGRFVWNRRRWSKHPDTRARTPKLNAQDEWVEQPMPALRIVDQEVWEKAQALLGRLSARPPSKRRRPRHFLSGLVRCAECSGTYTVAFRSRWGCARHKQAGTCSNGVTIMSDQIGGRVLAGLQEQLLSSEAVALVVKTYHLERERAAIAGRARRASAEQRILEADAAISRLVDAIAAGAGGFPAIRAKLEELSAKKDAAAADLAELEAVLVIALHPQIAETYRRRINELVATMRSGEVTEENSAGQIRALIDDIVLTPIGRGTCDIEVRGSLAAVLDVAAAPPRRRIGRQAIVGCGDRI